MIGLTIITLEILCVLILPILLHLDPVAIDRTAFNQAPGQVHLLGTDEVGRDMFARVVCGGQVSILIGFAATAISVLVGLPAGARCRVLPGQGRKPYYANGRYFYVVPSHGAHFGGRGGVRL